MKLIYSNQNRPRERVEFSTHLGQQKFFIEMQSTRYSRKLDTMGRIMLPKPLRDQMGLITGQEYDFFKYEDEDGRQFICIECPGINQMDLEAARRIVQKYGMN